MFRKGIFKFALQEKGVHILKVEYDLLCSLKMQAQRPRLLSMSEIYLTPNKNEQLLLCARQEVRSSPTAALTVASQHRHDAELTLTRCLGKAATARVGTGGGGGYLPCHGPRAVKTFTANPETALHYENVNNKKEGKKKYELFIPRYHEVIELQEEKEGFPGPGQYEMKSQFQKRENSPKG
ncbi:sperm-tail PG-rich repeat-containing protein 2 [Ciconia maguari]